MKKKFTPPVNCFKIVTFACFVEQKQDYDDCTLDIEAFLLLKPSATQKILHNNGNHCESAS